MPGAVPGPCCLFPQAHLTPTLLGEDHAPFSAEWKTEALGGRAMFMSSATGCENLLSSLHVFPLWVGRECGRGAREGAEPPADEFPDLRRHSS